MDLAKRPYLVGSTRYVTVGKTCGPRNRWLEMDNNYIPYSFYECLFFCPMLW